MAPDPEHCFLRSNVLPSISKNMGRIFILWTNTLLSKPWMGRIFVLHGTNARSKTWGEFVRRRILPIPRTDFANIRQIYHPRAGWSNSVRYHTTRYHTWYARPNYYTQLDEDKNYE